MNLTIRLETPGDYRTVEELTRDAFWGCVGHETTDGEHLLVHKLRDLPCFVPELDFVAEADGKLVGNVLYSLAKVVTPQEKEIEVLTFGPLSVAPAYKGKGVGARLMRHSIAEAKRLEYRAIIFFGHPDYYPRLGFRRGSEFGITNADGASFDALMAMPLYPGALDGVTGRFQEDPAFTVDPAETAEFDMGFPAKEPVRQLTVEELQDQFPEHLLAVLRAHKMTRLGDFLRVSGGQMLDWAGMSRQDLSLINGILTEYGYPKKVAKWHYEDDRAVAEPLKGHAILPSSS